MTLRVRRPSKIPTRNSPKSFEVVRCTVNDCRATGDCVNNKLKIALRVLLVIISGSCRILVYLVYPATPGKSSLLKFESFIVLPQGSTLNVLDCLIVSNDALFVAGLSQGSVFKIALDADGKRLGSTVSELQIPGHAHYFTRSRSQIEVRRKICPGSCPGKIIRRSRTRLG
jgi:hypothetical protein